MGPRRLPAACVLAAAAIMLSVLPPPARSDGHESPPQENPAPQAPTKCDSQETLACACASDGEHCGTASREDTSEELASGQAAQSSMEDEGRKNEDALKDDEEGEFLDDSVDAAMDGFKRPTDAFEGEATEDKGSGTGIMTFLIDALRSVYAIITYDFCSAVYSEEGASEPGDLGRLHKGPTTTPKQSKAASNQAISVAKSDSCEKNGSRILDWRLWRESGSKKRSEIMTRLACFLRRTRFRLQRKEALFWPRGDVCTALCRSCECDFDENSTCSAALLTWKARAAPGAYPLYAALHHSRLLCATAILLGVLRKKYVYKTVICAPLLILFYMVARTLYTLLQLRQYLKNTDTPAVRTRDCSYRQSEDEDVSPLERLRNPDLEQEDHPDRHAEMVILKLSHTMASLRSFCTFIDTTRGYYKTKVDNTLRELLDAVFRLQNSQTYYASQ